jgi:hypothetical protein
VLARFPALAESLPAPSDLRRILQDELGHKIDVVTGPDGQPRFRVPGGTLVSAFPTTKTPTSFSAGDGSQDAKARLRLRTATERGGFLVLKSRLSHTPAVAAELAGLDKVTMIPVTRLFVAALHEIATERGRPSWPALLAADSAEASTAAKAGFGRLVDEAWQRLDAALRAVSGIALLHDATPLARYHGGADLLARLASAARQSDEPPHGLWLLCPMEDPRHPATLDGRVVPALGDNEQVVLRPVAPSPADRRAS